MGICNILLRSIHKTPPKIHQPHYSTSLITQTLPKMKPQIYTRLMTGKSEESTQGPMTGKTGDKSGGKSEESTQGFEKKYAYLGRLAKNNMGRKAASNFESWKMEGFKPDQNSYKLLIGAQINSNDNILAFKYINQWVLDYKNDVDKSELNHFLKKLAFQCESKGEHEILRKIRKLNRELKKKDRPAPKSS